MKKNIREGGQKKVDAREGQRNIPFHGCKISNEKMQMVPVSYGCGAIVCLYVCVCGHKHVHGH